MNCHADHTPTEEIIFNSETSRWEFTYKGILRWGKTLEEAKFFQGVLDDTHCVIGQFDTTLKLIAKEIQKNQK